MAVDLVDHDHLNLTGLDVGKKLCQRSTVHGAPGITAIIVLSAAIRSIDAENELQQSLRRAGRAYGK